MAINLDLIKKKLQDIESSSKKSAFLWKPKPGEQTIRIVPYQHQPDFPFLELYFHYNIGKQKPLSLKTYGESDPIEEFALQLQQTGDKDDYKLGKKLEPQLRSYAAIIVRGEEAKGVKFWGFGKEIYTELLKTLNDPDYGDITDWKTGRDIVVEYKTPEEAKNTYGKITIRIKPNASPVTTDKSIFELIKNGQPKIEEVYPKKSFEDLEIILKKWLDPETNTPEEKNSPATDIKFDEPVAPPKEEKKTTPKPTTKANVLNEFDSMMADDDLPF